MNTNTYQPGDIYRTWSDPAWGNPGIISACPHCNKDMHWNPGLGKWICDSQIVAASEENKAMTVDDILDSLSDLMENARKKKDEGGENARKWAIMVTELEKLYAWYFTFLFGE